MWAGGPSISFGSSGWRRSSAELLPGLFIPASPKPVQLCLPALPDSNQRARVILENVALPFLSQPAWIWAQGTGAQLQHGGRIPSRGADGHRKDADRKRGGPRYVLINRNPPAPPPGFARARFHRPLDQGAKFVGGEFALPGVFPLLEGASELPLKRRELPAMVNCLRLRDPRQRGGPKGPARGKGERLPTRGGVSASLR